MAILMQSASPLKYSAEFPSYFLDSTVDFPQTGFGKAMQEAGNADQISRCELYSESKREKGNEPVAEPSIVQS